MTKPLAVLFAFLGALLVSSCGASGYSDADHAEWLRDYNTEEYEAVVSRFDNGRSLLGRFEALKESWSVAGGEDYLESVPAERVDAFCLELEAAFLKAEQEGRIASAATFGAMLLDLGGEVEGQERDLVVVATQAVGAKAPLRQRARFLVARTAVALGALLNNPVFGQDVGSQHKDAQLGGLFESAGLWVPGTTKGRSELTRVVLAAGGSEYEFVLKWYEMDSANQEPVLLTRSVPSEEFKARLADWEYKARNYDLGPFEDRVSELLEDPVFYETGGEVTKHTKVVRIGGESYWAEWEESAPVATTVLEGSKVRPGNRAEYEQAVADLGNFIDQRDREIGPRPSSIETYEAPREVGVVTREIGLRLADGSYAVQGQLKLTTQVRTDITYDDFWYPRQFENDFRNLASDWISEALEWAKVDRYEALVAQSRASWGPEEVAEEQEMRAYLLGIKTLGMQHRIPDYKGNYNYTPPLSQTTLKVTSAPVECRIEIPGLRLEFVKTELEWEQAVPEGEYFVIFSAGGKRIGKAVEFYSWYPTTLRVDIAEGQVEAVSPDPPLAVSRPEPGTGWRGQGLPDGMRTGFEYDVYLWDTGRGFDLEMVYVPPGDYLMGEGDEQHTRGMPDGYYIGRKETTWWELEMFRETTGPDDWDRAEIARFFERGKQLLINEPAVMVEWKEAQAFCEWVGLSLPSEPQWEKAARGADGRTYPWGDIEPVFGAERCNGQETPGARGIAFDVGRYPRFDSPWGALDMSGNVREWCADWYDEQAYLRYMAGDFEPAPPVESRVVRGGSFDTLPVYLRSGKRDDSVYAAVDIGFRPAL